MSDNFIKFNNSGLNNISFKYEVSPEKINDGKVRVTFRGPSGDESIYTLCCLDLIKDALQKNTGMSVEVAQKLDELIPTFIQSQASILKPMLAATMLEESDFNEDINSETHLTDLKQRKITVLTYSLEQNTSSEYSNVDKDSIHYKGPSKVYAHKDDEGLKAYFNNRSLKNIAETANDIRKSCLSVACSQRSSSKKSAKKQNPFEIIQELISLQGPNAPLGSQSIPNALMGGILQLSSEQQSNLVSEAKTMTDVLFEKLGNIDHSKATPIKTYRKMQECIQSLETHIQDCSSKSLKMQLRKAQAFLEERMLLHFFGEHCITTEKIFAPNPYFTTIELAEDFYFDIDRIKAEDIDTTKLNKIVEQLEKKIKSVTLLQKHVQKIKPSSESVNEFKDLITLVLSRLTDAKQMAHEKSKQLLLSADSVFPKTRTPIDSPRTTKIRDLRVILMTPQLLKGMLDEQSSISDSGKTNAELKEIFADETDLIWETDENSGTIVKTFLTKALQLWNDCKLQTSKPENFTQFLKAYYISLSDRCKDAKPSDINQFIIGFHEHLCSPISSIYAPDLFSLVNLLEPKPQNAAADNFIGAQKFITKRVKSLGDKETINAWLGILFDCSQLSVENQKAILAYFLDQTSEGLSDDIIDFLKEKLIEYEKNVQGLDETALEKAKNIFSTQAERRLLMLELLAGPQSFIVACRRFLSPSSKKAILVSHITEILGQNEVTEIAKKLLAPLLLILNSSETDILSFLQEADKSSLDSLANALTEKSKALPAPKEDGSEKDLCVKGLSGDVEAFNSLFNEDGELKYPEDILEVMSEGNFEGPFKETVENLKSNTLLDKKILVKFLTLFKGFCTKFCDRALNEAQFKQLFACFDTEFFKNATNSTGKAYALNYFYERILEFSNEELLSINLPVIISFLESLKELEDLDVLNEAGKEFKSACQASVKFEKIIDEYHTDSYPLEFIDSFYHSFSEFTENERKILVEAIDNPYEKKTKKDSQAAKAEKKRAKEVKPLWERLCENINKKILTYPDHAKSPNMQHLFEYLFLNDMDGVVSSIHYADIIRGFKTDFGMEDQHLSDPSLQNYLVQQFEEYLSSDSSNSTKIERLTHAREKRKKTIVAFWNKLGPIPDEKRAQALKFTFDYFTQTKRVHKNHYDIPTDFLYFIHSLGELKEELTGELGKKLQKRAELCDTGFLEVLECDTKKRNKFWEKFDALQDEEQERVIRACKGTNSSSETTAESIEGKSKEKTKILNKIKSLRRIDTFEKFQQEFFSKEFIENTVKIKDHTNRLKVFRESLKLEKGKLQDKVEKQKKQFNVIQESLQALQENQRNLFINETEDSFELGATILTKIEEHNTQEEYLEKLTQQLNVSLLESIQKRINSSAEDKLQLPEILKTLDKDLPWVRLGIYHSFTLLIKNKDNDSNVDASWKKVFNEILIFAKKYQIKVQTPGEFLNLLRAIYQDNNSHHLIEHRKKDEETKLQGELVTTSETENQEIDLSQLVIKTNSETYQLMEEDSLVYKKITLYRQWYENLNKLENLAIQKSIFQSITGQQKREKLKEKDKMPLINALIQSFEESVLNHLKQDEESAIKKFLDKNEQDFVLERQTELSNWKTKFLNKLKESNELKKFDAEAIFKELTFIGVDAQE